MSEEETLLLFLVLLVGVTIVVAILMTSFFERLEPAPDPMLMVAGTAFIIAAIGSNLHYFSLIIASLVAKMASSRELIKNSSNVNFLLVT